MNEKTYIAIDLKSFYASVECVERNLDPLTTNLVVADESRTTKTICLAVSPTLKQYGLSGRSRLYEVVSTVNRLNEKRRKKLPDYQFSGSSYDDNELKQHPELSINYVIARPRMALYMEYSTRIYEIYLKYFSPDDIHVYSIDEVFIDVTSYLKTYEMDAETLTRKVISDILQQTSITATAGIADNLYLCKVAKKHHIIDENVVVVEKSNTLKFIIRILVLFLKTAAWITLIILAAVGILCLIYPETRAALFDVLSGIRSGTETLIGQ